MNISSDQLKELRDKTGISVMQCKKALEEAAGDMEKALVLLKKKGAEVAEKKSDREFGAGVIGSYVHNTGEVAAMVHLACETDFVAKNEKFVSLAKEIAMHVAAMNPAYLRKEDLDDKAVATAKEVFKKELEGKPEELQEKIMAGKIDSYFQDQILLDQPFVKDPSHTIDAKIKEAVQAFGENIAVVSFNRMSIK